MNLRAFLYTVILLGMIGSGCSTAPQKGSPVYYQQDPRHAPRSFFTAAEDTLTLTRIKTKLFSDDLVDQGDIDITVRHGVVFLEGYARDIYHRRILTDLVQTVEGVSRVENRLGMKHPGTTFVTTEALIRDQIKMALLSDPELNTHPVIIHATTGQVILSGSVGSQAQKHKAAAIAMGYSGDRQVVNQLLVSD